MAKITGYDIQKMVQHWLETPVNGYLGSDYGQDLKSLLQNPMAETEADALLAKMRVDIPALNAVPAGMINIYSFPDGTDTLRLVIDVAGVTINLN